MADIAYFQCSSEEDLDCSWLFASGYDPTGRTLEVNIRDRASAIVKATLTVGSGLTVTGSTVKAYVAKATMAAWAKTEYSADLVDKTAGAFKRVVPTRFTYDDPGKLVGGAKGASFTIVMASNQAIITSIGGPGLQGLKGDKGDKGDTGVPGAGAPSSPDILAINQQARLERSLNSAGVPDEPCLILDFLRQVRYASAIAITASTLTFVSAIGGVSNFTRASAATYFGSDGLMKTAAANTPRIEHDPLTKAIRGLLIENQSRTNSNTYSEQLDHSSYSKARCSVVADAMADPFGTSTMDKVVEDTTASNSHYIYRNIGQGSGNASEQCFSKFVRIAERTRCRLFFCDFDTLARQIWCDFDLGAGTWGAVSTAGGATAGNAGLENLGGGLYRIYVTGTLGGGTSTQPRLYLLDGTGQASYTGDGASGLGSWGWDLEVGSRPSSYIQSVASAAVRAAETLRIDLAGWLASSGPISASLEFMINERNPVASSIAYIGDNSGQNAIRLREIAAGTVSAQVSAANVSTITTPGAAAALRTPIRMAFALDATSWGFSKDNAAPNTGGATAQPTGMNNLYVGANFMGHVRRLVIMPSRVSDAKVQILSNQAAWS